MISLKAAGIDLVLLLAYGIFGVALLVQFRGDHWLPHWVPDNLRKRPTNWIVAIVNVVWTGSMSLGGQVVVASQAVRWFREGELVAALISMIEIAVAIVMTIIGLRVSSRHESTR